MPTDCPLSCLNSNATQLKTQIRMQICTVQLFRNTKLNARVSER